MKRGLLLLVPLATACAHSPEQMQAWCERYAAKHVMYGVHEDPAAYREDLISSCMAMRKLPYQKTQASAPASARSSGRVSAR